MTTDHRIDGSFALDDLTHRLSRSFNIRLVVRHHSQVTGPEHQVVQDFGGSAAA